MHVLHAGIDVAQLRRDALKGKVSVEQLLNVIDKQQQTIQQLCREKQRLLEKLAPYEPDIRQESQEGSAAKSSDSPRLSYSLDAESKRRQRGQRRRRRKKPPGRRPTGLKFADFDTLPNFALAHTKATAPLA